MASLLSFRVTYRDPVTRKLHQFNARSASAKRLRHTLAFFRGWDKDSILLVSTSEPRTAEEKEAESHG